MYKKYLAQLQEAGKICNLKERSINCYKTICETGKGFPKHHEL